MTPWLLCVAAYVAGSIPFGMLLARAKGIDLRQVGSGNIGATNVARAMGKGWAVAVLAADAAKGFVPVWLGRRFGFPAKVIAARIDRIRDDGGEPFGDYQLPRAALALKQGFGRLIRTRNDRGIVAVLDGRVARKSYGATLVASLPPDCPRTESLEDVVAFWTRPPASTAAAAAPSFPPSP